MHKILASWEQTSTPKRIFLGLIVAAALAVMAMSFGGGIDLFSVETGVKPIK